MENNNEVKLPFIQYPALVCGPMVEQSELPFRLLTRKYGANLAFTPMLHSKMMTTTKTYKNQHFTTCPEDRPLVAQICGNDPEIMVKAARMLENEVDAIDINFGCPQGIARKGRYGSFLLDEPDLIQKIVLALSQNIKVPIFCKIRRVKSEQKTIELAKRIEKAGCKLLTVHGRTKEQNKDRVGQCDWDIIRKVKQALNIPVVANGGIYLFNDVNKCLAQTNADGVMSAQALLQNPALFCGQIIDLDKLAFEYLELAQLYKGADDSCIRAHLFKILYTGLAKNIDLRERMVKAMGIINFREIVRELHMRRVDITAETKLGWYLRYWKEHPPAYYLNGITVDRKSLQNQILQNNFVYQSEQEKEIKQKLSDANLTQQVQQVKF